MHQELKRHGFTLRSLLSEYALKHPGGYRYHQYCEHYRPFAGRLHPSVRQTHRAGEKVCIDFPGKRPEIVDPATGEATSVELLVEALGASSYIHAEDCTQPGAEPAMALLINPGQGTARDTSRTSAVRPDFHYFGSLRPA